MVRWGAVTRSGGLTPVMSTGTYGGNLMPRQSIYPMRLTCVQRDFQRLITTGQTPTGRVAAIPPPERWKNYRILGRHIADTRYARSGFIHKGDRLLIWCRKHRQYFTARPRNVLNSSKGLHWRECLWCKRESGEGRDFRTLEELCDELAKRTEIGFVVDKGQAARDRIPRKLPLSDDVRIPLICRKPVSGTGRPCGHQFRHSVRNIRYMLRHDPNFLRCQGPCDSRLKGKDRRIPYAHAEAAVRKETRGEWSIGRSSYRGLMATAEMRHRCGRAVSRSPYLTMLPYRNASLAKRATPFDRDVLCPYCSGTSLRRLVDGDRSLYAAYIHELSDGGLTFSGKEVPARVTCVWVTCNECGTEYKTSEAAIRWNVYRGCKTCQRLGVKSRNGWKLEEAQGLVAVRGFRLLDDPGSYITKAHIVDKRGHRTKERTILDLLRSHRASPAGFSPRPVRQMKWPMPNNGRPYSAKDDGLLRALCKREPARVIAERLGRSEGSVRERLKRLRLSKARPHINRLYHVRDDAFARVTPEATYWAGLLAADGTIHRDCKSLRLELKATDEIVLVELMRFLGMNRPLSYRSMRGTGSKGCYAGLFITSPEICADLKRLYGLVPAKSTCLPAPTEMSMRCKLAYAAGLIAGDGNLRIDRYGALVITLCSGSEALIHWYWRLCRDLLSQSRFGAAPWKVPGKRLWTLQVGGRAALTLGRRLLAVAGPMSRKWAVIEQALSQDGVAQRRQLRVAAALRPRPGRQRRPAAPRRPASARRDARRKSHQFGTRGATTRRRA
jgi:hypothetical protein